MTLLKKEKTYKLSVSCSIKPFREKAEKIWGLERYRFPWDIFKPVVFFGMYHRGDYLKYMLHMGENVIFWGGSDITNLLRDKLHRLLRFWFRNIDNYCENILEQEELARIGIEAEVIPSFLEDIDDFPVSFTPSDKPIVYISTRPEREDEYGLGLVRRLREKVPEVLFVVFDGLTSPDEFNKMIKNYHCGLRPNEHDGFSEITAKSVLMGQYPITKIKYPMIDNYNTEEELIALLKDLKNKKEPNYQARDYYRKYVNQYSFINK